MELMTKEMVIQRLWEIALIAPEETRGRLTGQLKCCKMLFCDFGYKPALQRLNEIANTDVSQTLGLKVDQERAAKLLKKLLSSIKPVKNQGIQ